MQLVVHPFKGRGATANPSGRFEAWRREAFDDGWASLAEIADDPPPATEVLPDASRTVIARNTSPDIPFDRSINPYRGCEHGCVYCYARPSHSFLGLSAGIDFETKLFAKHEAPAVLREELARADYRCQPIALGSNTDAYQPIERRLLITRGIVEVLNETRHPMSLVTKSALVLRDLDLLASLAADDLVRVHVSVTSLQPQLARRMEPRAAAPHRRLATIEGLHAAGIPVGVMVAPVIPGLNDHEIETVLQAAAAAGATSAGYVLLRLPFELKELFGSWLKHHYPDRADHVLSLIRQCRDGALNDSKFKARMRGQGPYADLIASRFQIAARRLGLTKRSLPQRTDLFRRPRLDEQFSLF